ncbi:MAG: hypothetical protein AAF623_16250 [Planctomycetota bacterium]
MAKTKIEPFVVKPGSKVKIEKIPTDLANTGFDKKMAYEEIEYNVELMADLAKKQ